MKTIFQNTIKFFCLAYINIMCVLTVLQGGNLYASTEGCNYHNTIASDEVRFVVEQAVSTGDNKDRPFVVLDKKNARIYVFNNKGNLLGDAPVLLGLAVGDEIAPEIARRPLSQIGPSYRITPAGRYYAETGEGSHGDEVLWVDYDTRLAIHPVATGVPSQKRLERLDSETTKDNRISWGCINVPKTFYKDYIGKYFATSRGMVYILPEVKAISDYQWFTRS
jgi:hypothetical protein